MTCRSKHSFLPSSSSPSFTLFRRLCLLALITFGFGAHAVRAQKNVQIVLTHPWTQTGMSVTAGERLTIQASGSMNWYTGGCPTPGNCTVDPNGVAWARCGTIAPAIVAPGINCWSLIGRIGGSAPFEVGTSLTLTASTSGELDLGVNDNNFCDNTGSWVATVTSAPASLTIASPPSGQEFFLSETSNTTTPPVTFEAGGATGEVSWTAALEYQTSGMRPNPPFRLSRRFQTVSSGQEDQTYASQGGKISVTAQSQGATTQESTFLVTGTRILGDDITARLLSLYKGATPRLMTGVAQVESSYFQFKRRPLYGTSAFWPAESASDGGSHIGLMMLPTADDLRYAWDWQVNTQAGVTLFNAKLASAQRLMTGIIKQHPGLRKLTPVELERMALVLYGPEASANLGQQYYAPARSGNGWTWIVNNAGNPGGVAYANSCFNSIHLQ
jgi:hypothetical protein